MLSAAVPADAGEESAPTAGINGAPAQGTTPARRRGRIYFVGFMPCRFQLAKLKAFARQGNTHFRVYDARLSVDKERLYSPFRNFAPLEYPDVVIHGVFSFALENGEGMSVGRAEKVGRCVEKVGRD